jgi:hypothetical protein
MAMPWCEFWAVEILMRMVLCALTDAINPRPKAIPTSSFEIFMLSPK